MKKKVIYFKFKLLTCWTGEINEKNLDIGEDY